MRRLAETQGGYFYPWRSELEPENGEDAYTALVEAHLGPSVDVLEAGCGHGVDALRFCGHARSFRAYDAVREFIEIAQMRAAEQGASNVEFVVADSSPKRNGGRARIPAAPQSVDLIVSRRGPTSWILDARRVTRPGGVLLQLNPLTSPLPDWNAKLPEALRMKPQRELIPGKILRQLREAEVPLESASVHDVRERFTDPEQLYRMLTWQRDPASVPSLAECEADLGRTMRDASPGEGVVLRHRRYLWKAVV